MDRESAGDLLSFVAVARERSFTGAAAKLRSDSPSFARAASRLVNDDLARRKALRPGRNPKEQSRKSAS